MKKILILALICIMVCCLFTACKSDMEQASEYYAQGQYAEALELLKGQESEEAQNLIKKCADDYLEELMEAGKYDEAIALMEDIGGDYDIASSIDSLMKDGKYQDAKDFMLAMGEGQYDNNLMVKCNIALLANYINEKGTKGDSGKRFYNSFGETVIYVESTSDDTLIMGYHMGNGAGYNDFKLYVDGNPKPFFEGESFISFSILGQLIETTSTGTGTVDISLYPNCLINVENFHNTGAVDYTGTTQGNILDQGAFENCFNDALNQIMITMPNILNEAQTDITMNDLGFGVQAAENDGLDNSNVEETDDAAATDAAAV